MKRIVQPDGWKKPRGYANGIAARGELLFVAGQVGWDPRAPKPSFPRGFAAQFDRALSNVLEVVTAAGGRAEDIVRLTVYVTDKRAYLRSVKEIGLAWRTRMGRHYPAMALVEVRALVEPRARVEIEATAVLPSP